MNRCLVTTICLVLLGTGACVEVQPVGEAHRLDAVEQGRQFVTSRAYRREALESSIVDPSNGYSTLRLQRYALDDDSGAPTEWDAQPVYNPLVRPVITADIGYFADDSGRESPDDAVFEVVFDGELEWTHEALMSLGQEAFERYPLQLDSAAGALTASRELVDSYGLWVDDRERVGGLVRVALPD